MTYSTPNLKASLTLVFLMCCVFASQAVAPNISYTTPPVYYQGAAITPLSPTNTGGAVLAGPATVSTFAGSTQGYNNGTGTAAQFNGSTGLDFDASGNMYVADSYSCVIRKVSPAAVVTSYAGQLEVPGYADGVRTSAQFRNLTDFAFDVSGNMYVADYANHRIRKITPAGMVSTFAGSGTYGSADGTGTAAQFLGPRSIAINASGDMYVAEQGNKIRKITPAGVVTTFAGSGAYGSANGTGTAASFNQPFGLALDASGNVYVSESQGHKIRKITPAGVVTTLAGSGTAAFADGTGTAASFNTPYGLVVDASGNVYVADVRNSRIRKITPAGVVTTLAGSGANSTGDGIGTAASFGNPEGLAFDASGNLFVADCGNMRIRKITQLDCYTVTPALPVGLILDNSTGIISGTPAAISAATTYTITGRNNDGTSTTTVSIAVGGFTLSATTSAINGALNSTSSVTISPVPNTLSWTASSDQSWLGVTASGTGAGTLILTSLLANPGLTSRTATVTVKMTGAPDQTITVTQSTTSPVLAYTTPQVYYKDAAITPLPPTNTGGAISSALATVTTLAGSGTAAFADGTGTAASFNYPYSTAVDGSGNVYIADAGNNKIRKITPAGVVTTFAGSGTYTSVDGTGTSASFAFPIGVTVAASGNIYVAEYNHKIRKITPAGVVTTLAGSGSAGSSDGTGTSASFKNPLCLAVDASGNVYVSDNGNNKIRKITPAGVVTTFAGSGSGTFADGTGTAASFYSQWGVAVDGSGNLYVADAGNHRIRKITPAGVVTTLAGSGTGAYADGTGTAASFNSPIGVAVDGSGNVYVADNGNQKIRKITPAGVVTTVAGSGTAAFADGTGTAASFNQPYGIALSASGDLYVADYGNNRIRKIALGGYSVSPALPAGLVLDGATGVISGTPTAISAATTYTVTGTNSAGASTATVSIAVGGFSLSATTSAINGALNSTSSVTITPVPNTLSWTASSDQSWLGVTPSGTGAGTLTFTSLLANPGTTSRTATVTVKISGAPDQTITVTQSTTSPVLAYTSPQVYYKGAAITPLSPTNTGGAVSNSLATVTTFAGSGTAAFADGTGTAASFKSPYGVAVDGSGNMYVADASNNRIRKITSGGVVTTLAGSGTQGSADGTGTTASFNSPVAVAVDGSGNLYVADVQNNRIRKITPAGVVTTLAGSGTQGSADGTGTSASFYAPYGVAVDASGNVYVTDNGNNKIRKITPAGVVTTLAGSGTSGSADGTGTAASFKSPWGIAVDGSGNVYVGGYGDNKIRKITPAGVVTTLAGSGTQGSADGTGTAASFWGTSGVAVDASGNVYVADQGNHKIRKITSVGVVSTVAGSGAAGSADGTGTAASFNNPMGVALSASGDLYVVDQINNRIRKIALGGYGVSPALPAGLVLDGATGVISGTPTAISAATTYTVTGTNSAGASTATVSIAVGGFSLSATTSAINGALNSTSSVTITPVPNTLSWTATSDQSWLGVTASGTGAGTLTFTSLLANPGTTSRAATVTVKISGAPDQTITVTQSTTSPVLAYTSPQVYYKGAAITPLSPTNTGGAVSNALATVTTFAGSGTAAFADGTGTAASFNTPTGVAVDVSGNVYVADISNNRIRKITSGGVVTTFAGSGAATSADGTGTAASFRNPYDVAVDASGNVYVADIGDNKIRKITPAGVVTTLAGSGTQGSADGTGTAASFYTPIGIAVDGSGTVYVADDNNQKIRKITPAGVVTTLAGSGTAGSADGTGTAASFNNPYGVALDASGNVYVADAGNKKIRKITPAGVVTTLAGSGTAGSADGTGTAASFTFPSDVAVDVSGNVYVADYSNNRIRKITPAGVVTTLAGSGTATFADGSGTAASFKNPSGVALSALGDLYVADYSNNRIRKIALGGYSVSPALPAGLVLDGATGIISGTPTAISAATTYTITGSNNEGANTATVSIAVGDFGLSATTSAINGALNSSSSVTISPVPNTLSWTAVSDQTWLGVTPSGTGAGTITFTSLLGNPGTTSRTATVTIKISGAPDQTITVTQSTTPPALAYTSPQVYYQDVAISPLSPTNTGGPVLTGLATVTTFAGTGAQGSVDATGAAASFNNPRTVAVDASGNVYVTDMFNNRIRKITPAGLVTTFAGSGSTGSADGTGTAASFNSPQGVAIDASGNVYVADMGNHKIRKITSGGVVTTFAGSGSAGSADGTGTAASFKNPEGIAVDGSGNVYVADTYNHKIRKITPAGVVSTFAGSGTQGSADGTGTAASFNIPEGIAVDGSGNVYVADAENQKIRKITSAGVVTTLAGSGTQGSTDGADTAASFYTPYGVAVDASGNVYVADASNHKIRKITSAGVVTTVAGSGTAAFADGTGTAASFNTPTSVAFSASGNLYVADNTNNRIRKITLGGYSVSPALPAGLVLDGATGIISGTATALSAATTYTVTGTNNEGASTATVSIAVGGFSLSATTSAINGALNATSSVTITPVPNTLSWTATSDQSWLGVTPSGTGAGTLTFTSLLANPETTSRTATVTVKISGAPDQTITVTQSTTPPALAYTAPPVYYQGTAISPLSPTNTGGTVLTGLATVTTLAGSGTATFAEGTGATASFNRPSGVAFDGSGNMYVADRINHRIRKITQAGVVTTLAGSGTAGSADGTGTAASFSSPTGVVVDASGNVYVSDWGNNRIRKITQAGVVTTLAGSSTGASGSANGTGTAASFSSPSGIAIDASGNVYVADYTNHKIRKITPAGVVTTLAGSTVGSADGTGTAATFNYPRGIAVDGSGNVYVADQNNNKIRKITPAGVVTTFAGKTAGTAGYADGTGTEASFTSPRGVTVDGSGNVYVADYSNSRIRKITPVGVVTTLSGNGTAGYSDGTGTSSTMFDGPQGIAADGSGNVFVAEYGNNRIRKIALAYSVTPSLPTGLTIDATTGIISGTPTALSATTTYTVTGRNNDGASTATVSIAVAKPLLIGDKNGDDIINGSEVAGDKNEDGIINGSEITGDLNGDGVIVSPEVKGDKNGDGVADVTIITGDKNGDGIINGSEIAGDKNEDGIINGSEITGDQNGDGVITAPEVKGDKTGDGVADVTIITGDKNGDGIINGSEIVGDKNEDGMIDGSEIAGDINGDGIINGSEITGDTNGDGTIGTDEITGDKNGDGVIVSPEVKGDKTGDGVADVPIISGDKNGDGIINGSEIAGDKNEDGIIDGTEIAGDQNGDGTIGTGETVGDTNGDGTIGKDEITGDQNGDGVITSPEVKGDKTGDGVADVTLITGDLNGDGIIGTGEIAGDTNGNGVIDGSEITGDQNGDGVIVSPEVKGDKTGDGVADVILISGDKNGDGIINGSEIVGDKNEDGIIDGTEIAGDQNGDGTIGTGEIVGDTNGDGKIGTDEIAGDQNGDGVIVSPEVKGDKNGDGVADVTIIAGDQNGDGIINGSEIAGDQNGDGIIDGTEIAGDKNGDGTIGTSETVGDTNGDGTIGPDEITGDQNGDGVITTPEVKGDKTGDGVADVTIITGDKNGDGIINGSEIAGDKNEDGVIDGTEIAGDQNGDGTIGTGETVGDTNGDGTIGPDEITGDQNGDGVITTPEVKGDKTGDGVADVTLITGDQNGDGIIGAGEIVGDVNGNGVIDGSEITGDQNGDGVITAPEVKGDKTGDGIADVSIITGDKNGDGIIIGSEIAGDKNEDGVIDGTEIAGDINGDGTIGTGEVAGDANGDGIIGTDEITGDKNGDGVIVSPEVKGDKTGDGVADVSIISGDQNGDGIINGSEIAGDKNEDGVIDGSEIAGDLNGDGTIGTGETVGDTNGDGTIGTDEITGDQNGDGVITSPEVKGDKTGDGVADVTLITGDLNGDGIIGTGEIAGDKNENGVIDGTEITGDQNGDGVIVSPEVKGDKTGDGIADVTLITGDQNGDGIINGSEIAGDTNENGIIDGTEIAGDINGDGTIGTGEIVGDSNGNGVIDGTEITGDKNGDGVIVSPEVKGDKIGDGIVDVIITGDKNGDGIINGSEIAGDTNENGVIDGTEIAGDINGDGTIGTGEVAGDANGDGTIGTDEITGDQNGDGVIVSPEVKGDKTGDGVADVTIITGDQNGDGTIGTGETVGDKNGDGTIGTDEITGDQNGDGVIVSPEVKGDQNGDGIADVTLITGDKNGDGIITGSEIAGDTNENGIINGTEITGDQNGDGTIGTGEITGDKNGNGVIDGDEIAGDKNGNGVLDPDEVSFKKLNLKVYLEGLWNGTDMNKCKKWDDSLGDVVDAFDSDIVDTISVELRDKTTYATIAYRLFGLELHANGTVTSAGKTYVEVPAAAGDDYYITIRTRNHLETTTASPVSFSGSTVDYDFSDAATKAYVFSEATFASQKLQDGKWMIYVADVLKDVDFPQITFLDLIEVLDNYSDTKGLYGYLSNDLNGDGFVDFFDLMLCFTNSNDGIYFYKE